MTPNNAALLRLAAMDASGLVDAADRTPPAATQKIEWVRAFINRHSIAVKSEYPKEEQYYFELVQCAFNPEHAKAAIIVSGRGLGYKCFHDSCQGYHWKEFRELFEKAGALVDFAEPVVQSTETISWESPIPLRQVTSPVAFPCGALPDYLRDFITAEAEFTQTPTALSGPLVLSVLAATMGGKIEVMARQGYVEPTNLYIAVALPSGGRKSQNMKDVTKPLADYERCMAETLRDEVAISESQARRLKKALDVAESAFANAKDEKTAEGLRQRADRMAKEFAALKLVKIPRYMAQDVTPESLASLLAENGGRMAIFSAEGELFSILAGRYAKGTPNIELFLKSHAGDMVRVDRQNKDRQPVYIEKPALTIGICLQPEVLRELHQVKGFIGKGLLARLLFVLPENNVGRRNTKPAPVPYKIGEEYCTNVKKLLEMPFAKDTFGNQASWTLTLDREASRALDNLMELVEKSLGDPEGMGACIEWSSKYVGAVIRIAGILHVAQMPGDLSTVIEPITEETLLQAIKIGDFFHEHAKAAFGVMAEEPAVNGAEFILRWLKARNLHQIQKKDLFVGLRSRFHKAAALDEPLRLLLEYGWIRESKRQSEGTHKPTTFYEVNPENNKR